MSNCIFPSTSLQPIQPIRFVLSDGRVFESILAPRPDTSGELIGSVQFELYLSGIIYDRPMIYDGGNTMLEAAEASFREVNRMVKLMNGVEVVKILLEGKEFLDAEDIESISGTSIPIEVY